LVGTRPGRGEGEEKLVANGKKWRQNGGFAIMLLASLPIWLMNVVGNPDQPVYRAQLAASIALTVALLLFGGWLGLHGEFPWSRRYWREKRDRESAWAEQMETERIAREAQYRTLECLARLCVEPVTYESGRVFWRATADKLREWLFIGALVGPEREVGQRLVTDCEVLADNPYVVPIRVKPPARRATVDALRDIVSRYGERGSRGGS